MQRNPKDRPILLVDDSDDIREVFKYWMELEGYFIECAASGAEALALLREGLNPCLALVDLNMPDLCGHEFVQKAHEESLLEQIPVYIFSAQAVLKPVPGTTGFIKKPVDFAEVMSILRRLDAPGAPLQEAP
ncbi:MAG: response regulator [Bdellovibrionaceae bacterium]|nr:response regulator [Pseudobdellovibrionaceae bacterium]